MKCLTRDLDHLYKKLNYSPSQELNHQIQEKRQALDAILTTNMEKALIFSKAKFLLYGNSTSNIFARKLNQEQKPPHLYKLCDQKGNLVTHPKEVLEMFTSFYKNLLSDPQPQNQTP